MKAMVLISWLCSSLCLAAVKEDCVRFDPDALEVSANSKNANIWNLVHTRASGAKHLMSAHPSESEAIQALVVIRKYGYTEHCFVGRPNPSMEYWK